jgi:hypothetical protein
VEGQGVMVKFASHFCQCEAETRHRDNCLIKISIIILNLAQGMVICLPDFNTAACTECQTGHGHQMNVRTFEGGLCNNKKSVSNGFGCLGIECESIGQI